MLLALLTSLVFAQQCPDLKERVDAARAQFDDAELERAKEEIAAAYDALGCQVRVVNTEELLALYRFDALVSMAQNDRKGATYATIRAVAADHEKGAPPAEFGPELADEYETWADRLGEALIYVRVAGGGLVYVDGRGLDASRYIQVTEGEHLVQVQDGDVVTSELLELVEDHIVVTGLPGPNPVMLPTPDPEPLPTPVPAPVVEPVSAPVVDTVTAPQGRRHPAGFFIGGLLAAGVGGGAIYWASEQEKKFANTVYDDTVYGGCLQGQDCFPSARARVIKGDADLINAGYGAGYALCALGGGLVLTGSIGVVQRPTMIQFGGRF